MHIEIAADARFHLIQYVRKIKKSQFDAGAKEQQERRASRSLSFHCQISDRSASGSQPQGVHYAIEE